MRVGSPKIEAVNPPEEKTDHEIVVECWEAVTADLEKFNCEMSTQIVSDGTVSIGGRSGVVMRGEIQIRRKVK